MSRIANTLIKIPVDVRVSLDGVNISIEGGNGSLSWSVHPDVEVSEENRFLKASARNDSKQSVALAGTTRALLNNMVIGVSKGFEKKLILFGVGYRAKARGKNLELTLGFSHPVQYELPESIKVTTPIQTEIVIFGADKQLVGQVAADIRMYRPPEPYKGKGIRYTDEYVARKEAKKK